MKSNVLVLGATLVLFLAATGDALAQQKRLYRWVDEDGNVFYSDQVPPDEVDHARDEFSERGTRAGQIERTPTTEERQAAAAVAAAQAEVRRAAEEDERSRRNLIIAYPSEEDLLRTQQHRIDMLESAITASRTSLASQERSLADVLGHAADAERAGQRVPEPIAHTIATLRQQVKSQMAQIAEKESEKEAALREQEVELARYRHIRGEIATSRH